MGINHSFCNIVKVTGLYNLFFIQRLLVASLDGHDKHWAWKGSNCVERTVLPHDIVKGVSKVRFGGSEVSYPRTRNNLLSTT